MRKKRVAVLGCTGSIGKQTLEIIRKYKDKFEVVALAAHTNVSALISDALEFSAKIVAIRDESLVEELEKSLPPSTEIVVGQEGLSMIASHEKIDIVVMAIAGFAAISPTLSAIKSHKRVCLANRECLVIAGNLVMNALAESQAELIPIDNGQSAIFQSIYRNNLKDQFFHNVKDQEIARLILTASGGPFFRLSDEELNKVGLCETLCHSSWKVGPKIAVDSSTLLSKGFEVIEAHHLFGMPLERIDVVIHPESIIHSMIEYVDHSIIAQMSCPNMTLSIQYALFFPERKPSLCPPFNFLKSHTLELHPVDYNRFRCLQLCVDAAKIGGTMPCFLNGASEVVIEKFLRGEISWQEISLILERLLEKHEPILFPTLEELEEVDKEARDRALYTMGVFA